METYPDCYYVGETIPLECKVLSRDGTSFTITAASLNVYDAEGTVVFEYTDDDDEELTIDGPSLSCLITWATGGTYLAEWSYTVGDTVGLAYAEVDVLDLCPVVEEPPS